MNDLTFTGKIKIIIIIKKNSWRNEDVLNSFVEEYIAGYEDTLQ